MEESHLDYDKIAPSAKNIPHQDPMRILGFASACMGRRIHLEKTLRHNLDTINCTDEGTVVYVVLDFSCPQQSYDWMIETFGDEIARGQLIAAKADQFKHFNLGMAKAICHSLASGYADCLFGLDADNFVTEHDLLNIQSILTDRKDFVAQQFSGKYGDGSYGRILLPSEIYRKTGGYAIQSATYGHEDRCLLLRAEKFLETKKVILGAPEIPAIAHSDDVRFDNLEGHVPGMTKADHFQQSEKALTSEKLQILGETLVNVYCSDGEHQVMVSHSSVKKYSTENNRS